MKSTFYLGLLAIAAMPCPTQAEAEEVAALVEMLALGDSGFVSGQVIPISGAWC